MTIFIRGLQITMPKPTILHRDPVAPPLPAFQLQTCFENELRQVLPPP